ncbi:glycosyltransferase [Gilvimarinus sp. F26214L]|uniref:glycosyltransferase n=1 Tax=Gilvimarinus sp. DZF01 TaxID=3461371 RepID=UPI00404662AA
MRSNYLATELARNHTVDLVALNQSRLLGAYYSTLEEGLTAAREALGENFNKLYFFDFDTAGSDGRKRLLALKSLFSELPYSVAWLKSEDLAGAIADCLARERYDLVHFDTVGLAQYRDLVQNIPTVLDHHNVESHMMLRRAEKEPNLARKLYFYQEGYRLQAYEKKVLNLFDGHITCSEIDSERLLRIGGDIDVQAIPNSVRVDQSFTRIDTDGRVGRLLFIGGLDWYPNRDAVLHFLKDIWPGLRASGLDVEVDIVGKNPDRDVLDRVRNDSRVRVHGFVDDIKAFYRKADIFICPIRDGGGTKLKVLDAMAHYLPVVGYPEACEGIDVRQGEHAMIAGDPDEFARAITDLLQDSDRARKIGQRAHDLIAEKYEARRVGDTLCNYYREIAAKA